MKNKILWRGDGAKILENAMGRRLIVGRDDNGDLFLSLEPPTVHGTWLSKNEEAELRKFMEIGS